jgi:hypothetical protein
VFDIAFFSDGTGIDRTTYSFGDYVFYSSSDFDLGHSSYASIMDVKLPQGSISRLLGFRPRRAHVSILHNLGYTSSGLVYVYPALLLYLRAHVDAVHATPLTRDGKFNASYFCLMSHIALSFPNIALLKATQEHIDVLDQTIMVACQSAGFRAAVRMLALTQVGFRPDFRRGGFGTALVPGPLIG